MTETHMWVMADNDVN